MVYPSIDPSRYSSTGGIVYENFILYIGRLVYYKGVDVLIRSFSEVLKDVNGAKLIIVGEGPMKQEWQNLVTELHLENSVSFLGRISNSEKLALLSQCSALALPSLFEGFGLVVLEAFALKKTVLVTNIPPFDEIVEDGQDGFLITPTDLIMWKEIMKKLLSI